MYNFHQKDLIKIRIKFLNVADQDREAVHVFRNYEKYVKNTQEQAVIDHN